MIKSIFTYVYSAADIKILCGKWECVSHIYGSVNYIKKSMWGCKTQDKWCVNQDIKLNVSLGNDEMLDICSLLMYKKLVC